MHLDKYEAERKKAMKQDDVTARVFASVLLNQVWKEAMVIYKDDPDTLAAIKTGLQVQRYSKVEIGPAP